ncbi:hypothetical protein L9F63_024039, partial [Diploptera punctata]
MEFGIPKKLVRLIRMCLNGSKSRVRVGKQFSDTFEIQNGLKQGDALSPLLFIFEEILKANTHTLLSNTKKLGLGVNINKTKYMVTRRNSLNNGNGQLMTNEGNFEEVVEFKYLGTIITNKNEMHKEIKHRLNSGNACYYALQRLLMEERGLQVFENKVLRKIFGPKRDEQTGEWRRLHNNELHGLYRKPDTIKTVKSRRLRWAGHVARMGNERRAWNLLVGKPEGKRPVGRPRMRWENNINYDL